jgi:hypothetical protein
MPCIFTSGTRYHYKESNEAGCSVDHSPYVNKKTMSRVSLCNLTCSFISAPQLRLGMQACKAAQRQISQARPENQKLLLLCGTQVLPKDVKEHRHVGLQGE